MTFINPQTDSRHINCCLPMILSSSAVMPLHSLTSNCLAVTISSSYFFLLYEALYILFSIIDVCICFIHLSLRVSLSLSESLSPSLSLSESLSRCLSPPPPSLSLLLDSVSSYSKSSSAFNSLCLSIRFTVYPCIFFGLFFSFSLRAWNYVPVWGMASTVNDSKYHLFLVNC